jgi:hypothetical protein
MVICRSEQQTCQWSVTKSSSEFKVCGVLFVFDSEVSGQGACFLGCSLSLRSFVRLSSSLSSSSDLAFGFSLNASGRPLLVCHRIAYWSSIFAGDLVLAPDSYVLSRISSRISVFRSHDWSVCIKINQLTILWLFCGFLMGSFFLRDWNSTCGRICLLCLQIVSPLSFPVTWLWGALSPV